MDNLENGFGKSPRKPGLGNSLRAAVLGAGVVLSPIVGGVTGMVTVPQSAEARVGPMDKQAIDKVHGLLSKLEQDVNEKWGQKLGSRIRIDKPSQMSTGGSVTVFAEGTTREIARLEYHQLEGADQTFKNLKLTDVAAEILLQTQRLRKDEFVAKGANIETRVSVSAYAQALFTLGGASYNQQALRSQLGSIPFTGENTPSPNREVKILGMTGQEDPTVLACVFTADNKLEGYQVILGNKHSLQQLNADEAYKRCK